MPLRPARRRAVEEHAHRVHTRMARLADHIAVGDVADRAPGVAGADDEDDAAGAAAESGETRVAGGWIPRVPEEVRNPGSSQRGGRHAHRRELPDAVADRMPLLVRAVWQRWAPEPGQWRAELGRGQVVVIAVVLIVGLGVAALVYGVGRPQPVPVGVETLATGTPVPDSQEGASDEHGPPESHHATELHAQPDADAHAAGAALVVHVAGEVAQPGVVTLPAGSRVIDAIDAAGGAAADVDLTGLNLARVLADGEQVLVGVEPPAGHEPPTQPDTAAEDPGGGGPVNLNLASLADLETLPGIGPTLAQRIVDWREHNGGFRSIEELHEVSGIGPSKFADIAPLVTL